LCHFALSRLIRNCLFRNQLRRKKQHHLQMGSYATIIMYLSTEKRQGLTAEADHTSHSFNIRNHSLARRTDSFGKQFFRWGYKSLARLGEEFGRWLTLDKFPKNRCPRPVGVLKLDSRSQSPTESHDSRRIFHINSSGFMDQMSIGHAHSS
jgi:hypothetical protein